MKIFDDDEPDMEDSGPQPYSARFFRCIARIKRLLYPLRIVQAAGDSREVRLGEGGSGHE